MWELSSLTSGAGTTTMQSVCSPIAWCWGGMHSIKSKAYSCLGVLMAPLLDGLLICLYNLALLESIDCSLFIAEQRMQNM